MTRRPEFAGEATSLAWRDPLPRPQHRRTEVIEAQAAVVRAGLDAPTQWGRDEQQHLLPRPRYLPITDPDARRDAAK